MDKARHWSWCFFFFGLEEIGFLQKYGTGRVNTMYKSIMKSHIYVYIYNHDIVYLHGTHSTHVGKFGCCLDELGNWEDFRCQLKQEKWLVINQTWQTISIPYIYIYYTYNECVYSRKSIGFHEKIGCISNEDGISSQPAMVEECRPSPLAKLAKLGQGDRFRLDLWRENRFQSRSAGNQRLYLF